MAGGVSLTVTGLNEPIAAFKNVQLGEYSDLMKEIGETIERQTVDHFDGGYGPDGAWAPHSPKTTARHGAHKILELRGDLRRSLDMEPGPLSVEVGTRETYGHFHQRGEGVPMRRYMGLTASEADEIRRLTEAYFKRKLGRGG